jgi:hypothetical protein
MARVDVRSDVRVLLMLLLCAGLALSACRKKSAREYYQLESTYSIMVARDGDDAYADPVMDQVLTQLRAIDPATVEGPKAAELAQKIDAERGRLAAEKAAAAAELAAQAAAAANAKSLPSLLDAPQNRPPPDAVAAVDAGPGTPYAEMAISEFNKRFGACMDPPAESEVPGLGKTVTFAVKKTTACATQFKVPDDTRLLYVFKDGVLRGERTEKKTLVMLDAGAPAAAPAPAPVEQPSDAGPRAPYVPGMPYPQ